MAPVILGIDFLHKHGLILDFTHNPVIVSSSHQKVEAPVEKSMAVAQVFPMYIYEATKSHISEVCATSIDQESEVDIVNDCAIPDYNAPLNVELPSSSTPAFNVSWRSTINCFVPNPGIQKGHGITSLQLVTQLRYHPDVFQCTTGMKGVIRFKQC